MGSAAPSRRRWIIALLLVAGVLVVAIMPLLDRSDPPPLADRAPVGGDGVAGGRTAAGSFRPPAPVATVAVELEEGWAVPDPLDGADAGHEHGVALSPGTPTVGAELAVPGETSGFVLRSDGRRRLAYRLGDDGGWDGRWRVVATVPDEGPDGLVGEEGGEAGSPASIPVLIGAADRIQMVDLGGTDRPVDLVFLPVLEALAPTDVTSPAAPTAVAGDGPPIMPRGAWTSAGWAHRNGSCDEGPAVADHLQALVVHHTVTSNSYGVDQVDDLLRAIHYSHTEINGWCDIGYNFVVDRFGTIWEARTGSIDRRVIGGHARGFNTGTLGVALLGQHHAGAWPRAEAVPAASTDAVAALAAWKLGAEGVDPKGSTWLRNRSSATVQRLAGESWHLVPTVLGHRDLGLTSCPGSLGYPVVAALADRLAASRDRDLPYSWANWQSHSHGPGFAVVDARGGVRPAGSAPPWFQAPDGVTGAGAVVAIGGGLDGGYLLTSDGSMIGYGSSPALAGFPVVGAAVDLVVRADGISGWVLDRSGALHGFGGATDLPVGSTDPVALAVTDDGRGHVLERSGVLVPVGGSPPASVAIPSGATAVDLALSGPGRGWVLDSGGRLLGFGGAVDHRVGSTAEPVAVVAAETEPGGWVLDRHGQLWPFGGARFILPVSTDAVTGDAVDADPTGLVFSADFLDSADARYLDEAHRLFLDRPATETELDLGVTGLEQGTDRIELTTALARSEAWAGQSLDQMYRDVLGRDPDPEGRAYWIAQITSGLKLQDLGTYFYGSPEYAADAGSEEAYVRGLYRVLLHREPDPDGLRYWIDQLASGRAGPPDVAAGFYASIESRRDRVARLHQRIMGSPADPGRRDAWAERLPTLGDVGLAAELAASSQFYRLATEGPEP